MIPSHSLVRMDILNLLANRVPAEFEKGNAAVYDAEVRTIPIDLDIPQNHVVRSGDGSVDCASLTFALNDDRRARISFRFTCTARLLGSQVMSDGESDAKVTVTPAVVITWFAAEKKMGFWMLMTAPRQSSVTNESGEALQ